MSSKDRFQRRARKIQKDTGWSYSECLRLARDEISEPALQTLIDLRKDRVVPPCPSRSPSEDLACELGRDHGTAHRSGSTQWWFTGPMGPVVNEGGEPK